MIKIDEIKAIEYHDMKTLQVPANIPKIENNPKVLEILQLKKQIKELNQKFELVDTKIQGVYNESLQRVVNISHNICTEFFNDQVKEYNEKVTDQIIFKIKLFKINLMLVKPLKLRQLKDE